MIDPVVILKQLFDDPIEAVHNLLWILLGITLLKLFDELNTPARKPKPKQHTGIVHWDESRGEGPAEK